jgi:hypothetical protein
MPEDLDEPLIARIRLPLAVVAFVGILLGVLAQQRWVTLVTAALLVLALAIYFRLGTAHAEPQSVRPPVIGRWVAVNSPATRCRVTACTPGARRTPST